MANGEAADRQQRLMRLLAPLHDRARMSARRLCRSAADGDDLFQDAVLRTFDRLNDLRDESRFPAWFYAVLLSLHRSHHRRAFWRRFVALDQLPAEPAHRTAAPDLDGERRMARALATLRAPYREAIVLFELDGFTIEEVAVLQKVSIPAVKSRLRRARASLRRHYLLVDGPHRLLAQEKQLEEG